jgi:MTH538 TIR-like domain (DUF1863)
MIKAFITYHHDNDQAYKDEIVRINNAYNIFDDYSVSTGGISDDLPTQTIRRKIRDEYLRDSTVTILLAGTETAGRKHVDWELKSSMIDGPINKKSGILVINLPSVGCNFYTASHPQEKEMVYPDNVSWTTITERQEYENRYPYMPERIIDNLIDSNVRISVVPWARIANNPNHLQFLINATSTDRFACDYDLSRPMRMANSPRTFR